MQLFVVHNPANGTVYVFDNHEAALECRIAQGLDTDHLIGARLCNSWNNGNPKMTTYADED